MGTESCETSNRQKETLLYATLFVTTVKSVKSCGHHEHFNNLFWVKLVKLLQFCVFPFSIFRPPTHPIRETLLKPTTTVLPSVVIVNWAKCTILVRPLKKAILFTLANGNHHPKNGVVVQYHDLGHACSDRAWWYSCHHINGSASLYSACYVPAVLKLSLFCVKLGLVPGSTGHYFWTLHQIVGWD